MNNKEDERRKLDNECDQCRDPNCGAAIQTAVFMGA